MANAFLKGTSPQTHLLTYKHTFQNSVDNANQTLKTKHLCF